MRYQVEKKDLRPITAACSKLLRVREAEQNALAERNTAIVEWWKKSVVPKSGASEAIVTVLREEGWTERDIAKVGVSVASTIAILTVVPAYPGKD